MKNKLLATAIAAAGLLAFGATTALGQTGGGEDPAPPNALASYDVCTSAGVPALARASDTGYADLEGASPALRAAVSCLVSYGIIDEGGDDEGTEPAEGMEPATESDPMLFSPAADADASFVASLFEGARVAAGFDYGEGSLTLPEGGTVSRQDAAVAIGQFLAAADAEWYIDGKWRSWREIPTARNPHPLSDILTANPGGYAAIQRLYETGITTGYGDGTFKPRDAVSRGEAALFVRRAIDFVDVRPVGVAARWEKSRLDAGNGDLVIWDGDDAPTFSLTASVIGPGFTRETARVAFIVTAPGSDPCDKGSEPGCVIGNNANTESTDGGTVEFTGETITGLEDGSVIRFWTGDVGDRWSEETAAAEVVVSLRPAAAMLTTEHDMGEGASKVQFGTAVNVTLTVADEEGKPVDYSGLPDNVPAIGEVSIAESWSLSNGNSGSRTATPSVVRDGDNAKLVWGPRVETDPSSNTGDNPSTWTLTITSPADLDLLGAEGAEAEMLPDDNDEAFVGGTLYEGGTLRLVWAEAPSSDRSVTLAPRSSNCGGERDWACVIATDEGETGASASLVITVRNDFGTALRKGLPKLALTSDIAKNPGAVPATGTGGNVRVRPQLTRDSETGLVETFTVVAEDQVGMCRDSAPDCDEMDDVNVTDSLPFYWADMVEGDDVASGDIALRSANAVVFTANSGNTQADRRKTATFYLEVGCYDRDTDCKPETDDNPAGYQVMGTCDDRLTSAPTSCTESDDVANGWAQVGNCADVDTACSESDDTPADTYAIDGDCDDRLASCTESDDDANGYVVNGYFDDGPLNKRDNDLSAALVGTRGACDDSLANCPESDDVKAEFVYVRTAYLISGWDGVIQHNVAGAPANPEEFAKALLEKNGVDYKYGWISISGAKDKKIVSLRGEAPPLS